MDRKSKIAVFSFDDGEIQDIKLTKLLRKYGLNATFGLCTGYIGKSGKLINPRRSKYEKICEKDLKQVYEGFEVCSHGEYHQDFRALTFDELSTAVNNDKKKIREIFGYKCEGAIYPGGSYDKTTMEGLKKLDIKYARTVNCSYSFEIPHNFLAWNPSGYIMDKNINSLIDKFINTKSDSLQLLHIYGHSYELDFDDGIGWSGIENIFAQMSCKNDIMICSCSEAYKFIIETGIEELY